MVYYSGLLCIVQLTFASCATQGSMTTDILTPFEPAPLSLYIHVPFCRSRCSYCAFNTYAGAEALIPAYVDAMCREIAWLGQRMGRPTLQTIYIGGGTPSVLTAEQMGSVLRVAESAFTLASDVEITAECNPTGVDHQYFAAIRACGVNRLSIGAQTAHADELRLFGRRHTWADVIATVKAARAGGFDNISLDLIYGAPNQTLNGWHTTLTQAVACDPSHISLYALSLEPGTALYRKVAAGHLTENDSDLSADMYDLASDFLQQAGYDQYEISNWAWPGYACAHNLQYWRRAGGYLAIGSGAYGYLDRVRYGVVDSIRAYIEQVNTADPTRMLAPELLSLAEDPAKQELLSEAAARSEAMILGLRLVREGVSRRMFERRFGRLPEAYYASELRSLLQRRLITDDVNQITICAHARLVANQVMVEFV